MKPSEILREAVKLDWTQGALAVNAENRAVSEDSRGAVSFCAVGRLLRTCKIASPRYKAYEYLAKVTGEQLAGWNDTPGRTREEVDAAFLKAAELAEKDGQ